MDSPPDRGSTHSEPVEIPDVSKKFGFRALVAATGEATSFFDRFAAEAINSPGYRFVECTPAGASVRLGTIGGECGVLATGKQDSLVLAALGSGVSKYGPDASAKLLEAVESKGNRFLDEAPIDMAVLLTDVERGTLRMATCSGHHRIFITREHGGVLASTQLSLLAEMLGPQLRVDRSYEDFLLGFGFLPDGRTVYRGIQELPRNELQDWPNGTSRTISPPEFAEPAALSDIRIASRKLYDTFFDILEEQTSARDRCAVLLGGLDSALVAAGLRQLGLQVDTYTFAFGDPRYEQQNAELLANYIGAQHTWVRFTPDIIGDGLEHFSDVFNQPGVHPHYLLHTLHASRVIAQHDHDVIFTGDGCDSAFLGYPSVSQRARLLQTLELLPASFRQMLLRVASRPSVEKRLGHVARLIRSTLRSLELPSPARGHLPTQYMDEVALDRLRLNNPPPQSEEVEQIRIRLASGLDSLEPVRLAFHGNSLTGQSGAKVEGAVVATGIPQMSPYRHPRMRDFTRALPTELFRPPGTPSDLPGKAVLLKMVREHDLLPREALEMRKQSPVDSPIDRWYAGVLRLLVGHLLDDLPFEYDRRYVDQILAPKKAEELFRKHISLGHQAFQAIGILCSYASFTGRIE